MYDKGLKRSLKYVRELKESIENSLSTFALY